MRYTQEVANTCAGLGAQLLDRYDPNWYLHLDLQKLDMQDCTECVIGQLYPVEHLDWQTMLDERWLDTKWRGNVETLVLQNQELHDRLEDDIDQYPTKLLGFDVPDWGDDDDEEDEDFTTWYKRLNVAWLAEIDKRRA